MSKPSNDQPKILVLDIETKLMELYSFAIRDIHVTHKQIKSHGGISCIGMKWVGEKKPTVLSEWRHGYGEMMRRVHSAICEAHASGGAVLSYNGVSFDLPKIDGAGSVLGLEPLPDVTQIDIYKTVRKMGFPSSKLDYIAPLYGLGSKVKHDGMDLWIKVLNGDEAAQRKMEKYCAGDINLTEALYLRLRPYMRTHPRLGNRHGMTCPNCGSDHLTSQGWKITRTTRVQSLKCADCGSWTQGKRERIAA